jgi:probable rRNA maturation factor
VKTGHGTVEVTVDGVPAPSWRKRLPRFCARVLSEIGAERWEVAILLCGDARIAALNGRFRGKPRPTDVLSFPREEGAETTVIVGDLAICLEALRRNALRFEVSEDEELKRLLVHGLLHLAGMDHGRGMGRKMLALQERLLNGLGGERIMAAARTGRGSS